MQERLQALLDASSQLSFVERYILNPLLLIYSVISQFPRHCRSSCGALISSISTPGGGDGPPPLLFASYSTPGGGDVPPPPPLTTISSTGGETPLPPPPSDSNSTLRGPFPTISTTGGTRPLLHIRSPRFWRQEDGLSLLHLH